MQRERLPYYFVLIGLLLQANFIQAEIYRSIDQQGRITFTDKPSTDAVEIAVSSQPYRYLHQVKRVYDGDTILLENGERVRLLGINTPEIDSHFRQVQQGGEEAKTWLEQKLVAGKVYLEYDAERRDKYQRLLAYCFLADGEHLNLALLQQGLAVLNIIPPNVRYTEQLIEAQLKAQREQRGLWALADYQAKDLSKLNIASLTGWHRLIVTPQSIKQGRRYLRLMVNKDVEIRIPHQQLSLFENPQTYIGRRLEIQGWFSRRGQHYSIVIMHPSALHLL